MKTLIAIFCFLLAAPVVEAQTQTEDEAIQKRPEPDGALAWFKRGVELSRRGEYAAALSRFKRARQLAPNWALPRLEIAVAT